MPFAPSRRVRVRTSAALVRRMLVLGAAGAALPGAACSSSSNLCGGGGGGFPTDWGSSDAGGTWVYDAGADDEWDEGGSGGGSGAYVGDAGLDPTVTPVEADGGTPPKATLIDAEPGCVIAGVTDDGYVVYATNTALKAAPVAGGTVVTLVTGDAWAVVAHNVVFVTSSAGLAVWTSAMAAPQPLPGAQGADIGALAASRDSSFITYSIGPAYGEPTTLFGAGLASLASPTTLATSLSTNPLACAPTVAFSGTGTGAPNGGVTSLPASTYAVAVGCGVGPKATIASYAVPTWKGSVLTADGDGSGLVDDDSVVPLSIDTLGQLAAIGRSNGAVDVVPLAGGAPVQIAPAGSVASALYGWNTAPASFGGPFYGGNGPNAFIGTSQVYLSKTDAFALLATTAGELDALSVDGSRKLRLASTGATTIDAVSGDEAWALYDSGDSPASNLWIASTTGAVAPAQLALNERSIGIFGDPFTTDSRFAVFMVEASEDSASNTHGALVAASVSSPTILIPLASRSGITASFSPSNIALAASKLSFVESFDPLVGLAGSADIRVVDLAATQASTLLVAGADPMYAVSFDQAHVLYTVSRGGSSDGIYSVPAPH